MICKVCGTPGQLFSHTFQEPLCHRCLLWAVGMLARGKARLYSRACGVKCGGPSCEGFDGVGCA